MQGGGLKMARGLHMVTLDKSRESEFVASILLNPKNTDLNSN
jgi:hypothetical protein